MRMKKIRELAISGGAITPDADPNLTAPPAADCYAMTGEVGDRLGGETQIEGHRVCLRFVTSATPPVQVPGATGNFQTWVKDDGASAAYLADAWCSLAAETVAKHGQLYAAPLKGKLFTQLTAVANTGAATKVQVWLEESSSVEG
jgi:hypothetical protein